MLVHQKPGHHILAPGGRPGVHYRLVGSGEDRFVVNGTILGGRNRKNDVWGCFEKCSCSYNGKNEVSLSLLAMSFLK